MHICFLCDEYPPASHGGIGVCTQMLGRELAARGHRISVVGIERRVAESVENDHGVTVYRLPARLVRGTGYLVHRLRLQSKIRELHRETPIDVLEGTESSLCLTAALPGMCRVIRMQGGHRFFADALATPLGPWRCWLESRSFRAADALCAASSYVAENTCRLLGLHGVAVAVLPNPTDTNQFCPPVEPPVKPGRLVYFGTLTRKKGVEQLMDALPAIKSACPHAELHLLGRDTVDPATGGSFAMSLLDRLPADLREACRIHGAIPHGQIHKQLAEAQVAVLPSHMEAFGNVFAEAMAMGLPVVAPNKGTGPELVEDGISGVLCDPHSATAIADACIRLLKDPELCRKLGAAARRRAEERYSLTAVIQRNEVFYASCVGKERMVSA